MHWWVVDLSKFYSHEGWSSYLCISKPVYLGPHTWQPSAAVLTVKFCIERVEQCWSQDLLSAAQWALPGICNSIFHRQKSISITQKYFIFFQELKVRQKCHLRMSSNREIGHSFRRCFSEMHHDASSACLPIFQFADWLLSTPLRKAEIWYRTPFCHSYSFKIAWHKLVNFSC